MNRRFEVFVGVVSFQMVIVPEKTGCCPELLYDNKQNIEDAAAARSTPRSLPRAPAA